MTRHGSLSHMASSNQLRPTGWRAPCRMTIAPGRTSAHQNATKRYEIKPASSDIDPTGLINDAHALHPLAAPKYKTP